MDNDSLINTSAITGISKNKIGILAWSIFITGILYYCLAYLLRIYPNVMEHNLLAHFHVTAGDFGILTSFYYFAYAPMQLPVGVTVDRIGVRKSLLGACLISTLGILIFAASKHYAFALLGRFMIGFGSAFAYVTALKIATLWLPRKYFATATGFVTGSGMVAAIFTDMYLTHIVDTAGYKTALYFPLIVAVFMFFLILVLVKDKSKNTTNESTPTDQGIEEAHALSYRQLLDYLILITKNRQMWIIGLIGALLYMPSSVFLDVWAIPYLKTVYHLSPERAALGFSVMLTGWICSSFATGALSDIFGTRKLPLIIATFGATAVASMILYLPLSENLLFILLFTFGVLCGPHPLCFTLSKENNISKISGTAVAFANFVIMMGGFIFQPVVGKLLDYGWTGTMVNGVRTYTNGDYTMALSILPIGLLIAGFLTFLLKETYQKTTNSTDD